MKLLKKTLFLILIITLSACGQTTKKVEKQQAETQLDWQTFAKENYTIKYPKKWELHEENQIGAKFVLLTKVTSSSDIFRENVNVMVQDLKGMQIDLDKFVKISEDQINKFATDAKIIVNKRKKNEQIPFQKLIYFARQGIYKLNFIQYYYVIDQKAYIITFTGEASEFSKYKVIAEQILDSFTIK